MIRILIINLVLFAAPFVAVWLWMRFVAVNKPDAQRQKLYAYAALAGLLLVVSSLMAFRLSTGNAPGGTYISPSYKDGEIVPGRFE